MKEKHKDYIVGSFLILFIIGIFYTSHIFGVMWDENAKQKRGWEDKCKSFPINKRLIDGYTWGGPNYAYDVQYFCERSFVNGSTTEYTYTKYEQLSPNCDAGISICN
jgi:hypothetical protein